MEFKEKELNVKQVPIDLNRAKSLIKSSSQSIQTAKSINLNSSTSKTIFRELYEGFREFCEALGYARGYKFLSHIIITSFIREILDEKTIALKFDRYRKLRNGINYYGNEIEIETVKSALIEIPKLIKKLKKFLKI